MHYILFILASKNCITTWFVSFFHGTPCFPCPPSFRHPQGRKEPEYLDYNIKGRSVFEAAPYNAGACYLMGECRYSCWVVPSLTIVRRLETYDGPYIS